jgi:anti-anti-sigma regulatory factor
MQAGQSPRAIKLSGLLTVDRATSLKTEIVAALGSGGIVHVDLSAIEEIDLSCLQVLYAAIASAKTAGRELHLVGPLPSRIAGRLASCGFLHGASGRSEDLESALSGF